MEGFGEASLNSFPAIGITKLILYASPQNKNYPKAIEAYDKSLQLNDKYLIAGIIFFEMNDVFIGIVN